MADSKVSDLPTLPTSQLFSDDQLYVTRSGQSFKVSKSVLIPPSPLLFQGLGLDTVQTQDNNWTPISTYQTNIDTTYSMMFEVYAERSDLTGYFLGIYHTLTVDRGSNAEVVGDLTVVSQKSTDKKMAFRIETAGNQLSLEVKGRSGETWNWRVREFDLELSV